MQNLYEKARRFVHLNARPLDYARWRYHFENGSAEEVLRVLSFYQNDDGGFGHGLEADALNPGSSPIQSWSATMVLREVGLYDEKHPIVAGIVRYLTSGMDFDGECWDRTVPGNNDYPHAPWWSYVPGAENGYNPTASLAGYLLRVSSPGSETDQFARRIAMNAYQYALTSEDISEMHLLPCFVGLCRDVITARPGLFDAEALLDRLRKSAQSCVERDADRWTTEYSAMPSFLISGLDDPLYTAFPELAERECAFIEQTQQDDGAWPVSWSWGAYPDAFAISANRWQSWIILKNLLYLRGMGKLTGNDGDI